MTQPIIYWFNPITFTFLQNASVWTTVSLALYNNAVFTAIDNTPTIYVLDNTGKNQIINITDRVYLNYENISFSIIVKI